MSNLNELFNKHSRVHPWAETDNKKTLDLEGLEAVIAEMMPSESKINSVAFDYANRVCNGEFPITYTRQQVVIHTMNDYAAGMKHLRSTLLGSDKKEK
jgi:hypothetical protein